MRLLPFLPCLLLSLLLGACGGGGEPPAAARAQGLTGVDVEDSNGQTVMRHRFSAGASASEDLVTVTQDAGNDGVWGTPDDWRTSVVHCRYQAGSASGQLEDVLSFSPESFFAIDPAACTWRRPLNGSVVAEIEGDTGGGADYIRGLIGSPTGQILFAIKGYFAFLDKGDFIGLLKEMLGEIPLTKFSLSADSMGTSLCYGDCVQTDSVSPAAAGCRNRCDLFGETLPDAPVADGLPISLDPCVGAVSLYDGMRFAPAYRHGRLRRVVASHALNQPFCYPYAYTLYERDAAGKLLSSDDYVDAGTDGVWFTADDTRYEHMVLQSEGSTVRRSYYHGAGEDGVWGTMDDVTDRVLVLTPDSRGRLAKARRCFGAGEDGQWNTADDVCEALTFHYAD